MKFRAVETYFLHGWRCQVFSQSIGRFVDIETSPIFETPNAAIFWGLEHWNNI